MKAVVWQDRGRGEPLSSHIWVIRTAAPLGRHPSDVLIRILDIAGFAVDAVLRVDDKARITALLHPFIDAGRTITRRRSAIDVMLGRFLQRHFPYDQMRSLAFFVVGIG